MVLTRSDYQDHVCKTSQTAVPHTQICIVELRNSAASPDRSSAACTDLEGYRSIPGYFRLHANASPHFSVDKFYGNQTYVPKNGQYKTLQMIVAASPDLSTCRASPHKSPT